MFLPTSKDELKELNWDYLDVILITGDAYIDSPYIGVAVIGKILLDMGLKVGVIAQPDYKSDVDIKRLGEPRLFWGVSSGSVDSMVANYTATKKRRHKDDYTPDGINNKRPDRAVIVYTNLIRQHFKNTKPIVIGGIEASLRRIAHYDFWSNSIRKSILFDSKADILLYGMAERSVKELANSLKAKCDYKNIRGICYISNEPKEEFLNLPSFEEVKSDKLKFIDMFVEFYNNNDPISAKGLNQKHDNRYLIQTPPAYYLDSKELDSVYNLEYERDAHPIHKKDGKIKALETIKFSITTHQGCYGECNFCAISVHQGRTIRSRSHESIINEAKLLTKIRDFKGYIFDVGGPTANMYDYECDKKLQYGTCTDKRCVSHFKCKSLKVTHKSNIDLLKKIRSIDGIKKVFVASGIRYDLINEDSRYGDEYLKEIVNHHTSGQLKIAPEHTEERVLRAMGKPNSDILVKFKEKFDLLNKKANKKQFLTYYFISAHPSSTEDDMRKLKDFTQKVLKTNPEQIQVFTPTPSTFSTLMYYTELDPFTKKPIFVEKDINKKEKQKDILLQKKVPTKRF
jgi:uncharacterized radical SAM protein YgiQ